MTQARTPSHTVRGCCMIWSEVLDMARGCQGEADSGRPTSPPLPSPCCQSLKGKAGGRAIRRALLTARAREVGLTASPDDPSTLRAGPFWSRLKNPPEPVGAVPAAWRNVFQSLRASILLPCLSFRLQAAQACTAVGWRLGLREESSTAPRLA